MRLQALLKKATQRPIMAKADLFELVFHVSWGLESLERESQERYHVKPTVKSLNHYFIL